MCTQGYMNDGRGGPGGKQQFMQFAPLMRELFCAWQGVN